MTRTVGLIATRGYLGDSALPTVHSYQARKRTARRPPQASFQVFGVRAGRGLVQ